MCFLRTLWFALFWARNTAACAMLSCQPELQQFIKKLSLSGPAAQARTHTRAKIIRWLSRTHDRHGVYRSGCIHGLTERALSAPHLDDSLLARRRWRGVAAPREVRPRSPFGIINAGITSKLAAGSVVRRAQRASGGSAVPLQCKCCCGSSSC